MVANQASNTARTPGLDAANRRDITQFSQQPAKTHFYPQGLRAMHGNQNVPGLGPTTILVVLHRHAGWREISRHRRKSKQVAHSNRDTLDRKCRRNLADEFSRRRERSSELRRDTSRTGAHRLLSRPKSVLSGTIRPCRSQSARSIRRRVVLVHTRLNIDCSVSNKGSSTDAGSRPKWAAQHSVSAPWRNK
jgi:hypothetical protein